jgi:hypothetical protein
MTFVKIWSTVGPLRVELMTLSRRRRRRKRGKLRGKKCNSTSAYFACTQR